MLQGSPHNRDAAFSIHNRMRTRRASNHAAGAATAEEIDRSTRSRQALNRLRARARLHWRAANCNRKFFDSSSQRLYQEYPLGRFTTTLRAESFSVWTSKLEAARIRFADGSRRAGWSKLEHEIHQRDVPFVSNHVHVAG
jgi:hypothetical protein